MIKDQWVQTHCCPLPFSQPVLGSATRCRGQPGGVWSLFLQQSHQVIKAEQFRGAQLCQDCDCSLLPMPAPGCSSPAFLAPAPELIDSQLDSLKSQNQSTIFRRFRELGEPGRFSRCWLDGNGKATREQGAMSTPGQPGWWVPWAVPPEKPLHS